MMFALNGSLKCSERGMQMRGWEIFGAIMTVFYKLYNNALQIHAAILLPPFLPRATI